LTLFAAWRLAARMRGDRFALLVLVLVGPDGMIFVLSRIAMNDIYATACVVLALSAFYRFWTDARSPLRWLVATGAAFGVGITMKWSVLAPFCACATLAMFRLWRDSRERNRLAASPLTAPIAWSAAFIAIPAAIYLTAYLPFFFAGHGFGEFLGLQQQMHWYHTHLTQTHHHASSWFGWPWIARPHWFYQGTPSPGWKSEIYAMGNPALWWLFVPSMVWVAARFYSQRAAADALMLVGFCTPWLPWMFIHRIGFVQYLLPSVPFGALAVASTVEDIARALPRARWIPAIHALLCMALFVWFLPVWSATPLPAAAIDGGRYLWFPGWR
jgi:dolichyl-phosphate-mannose--protein O-mannosyl transferase